MELGKYMMMSDNADELWDLYTKDRQKTGRTHRRGDVLTAGQYHMAVHICIFNSKNQLLIQQRQPYKKDWPNMWDVSAAGSAVAGDSSCQAAQRELMEELGLLIDMSDARPFFTMNFSGGFDDFYIVEQDVDLSKLRLQKEEVKQVRWADKEEVIKMQAQGIMIPYWFLDRLFDVRDRYDKQGERKHQIRLGMAGFQHLESWMSLAEIVRDEFPGMDTNEAMNDYCDTVIRHIRHHGAVYAADGNMIVGVLLYQEAGSEGREGREESRSNMEAGREDSKSENEEGIFRISCLAVHPEFRRQRIAQQLVQFMMHRLKPGQKITVDTFREDDEKGEAARAFYQSMGFVPGEQGSFQGYPVQEFLLM